MRTLLAVLVLLLTGCSTIHRAAPADEFFARLSSLCGKAFEGRIVSPAEEANRDFAGKRLVMHVRECAADTIRIPFHVGDNRSRTFVITRTPSGLRLKHDHRHEDGSAEKLTQYGGDTIAPGTLSRQEFPADQFSRDLFVRERMPASAASVWVWEVEPGRLFAFELRRPKRFLRVDFDLSRSVAAPPAPWGSR
ncbi:MAG: hypothetical protein H0T82_11590 [Sphingomonas sp.]|nr:hypothetical protein [Sphingomonas sp.]